MNARQYYDAKSTQRRWLSEGDGIRNTHNFIKATLIGAYVPVGAHIIDLGCGQGGDLLKFKRQSPKSYRGIDISHTAIESISKRIRHINIRCRYKLECFDFSERDWSSPTKMDVVNCQFAIQYAFSSREQAEHVFARIGSVLKLGGVFIGTVPIHTEPSHSAVIVMLPDDRRKCVEYSAHRDDVIEMCALNGMTLELWQSFTEYYNVQSKEQPRLLESMRATAPPDPKNAAFVFRKTSAEHSHPFEEATIRVAEAVTQTSCA